MDKVNDINFTLLENALDFIQESIESFNDSEKTNVYLNKKKSLKYAILHLSSGIELLLKQRLYNDNWTYIVDEVDKITKDKFFSGDFVSVDNKKSINRLQNLCNLSFPAEDLIALKNLRSKRNLIEHFKIQASVESMQTTISVSLSFAIRFITQNFIKPDVKFKNIENALIEKIKKSSRKIKILEAERIKLITQDATRQGLNTNNFIICPDCFKKMYCFDDKHNECLFCSYEAKPEELARSYHIHTADSAEYYSAENEKKLPVYNCINCGTNSMVKRESNDYFCFSCKELIPIEKIKFCEFCGNPYSSDDNDGDICECCIAIYDDVYSDIDH